MATITYISSNNENGRTVMAALKQIREGLGTLNELNGLRAESIGVGDGAVTMKNNFGIQDETQAQTLSDRWGDLMNVMFNANDQNYNNFVYLRDLINATTWWV